MRHGNRILRRRLFDDLVAVRNFLIPPITHSRFVHGNSSSAGRDTACALGVAWFPYGERREREESGETVSPESDDIITNYSYRLAYALDFTLYLQELSEQPRRLATQTLIRIRRQWRRANIFNAITRRGTKGGKQGGAACTAKSPRPSKLSARVEESPHGSCRLCSPHILTKGVGAISKACPVRYDPITSYCPVKLAGIAPVKAGTARLLRPTLQGHPNQ